MRTFAANLIIFAAFAGIGHSLSAVAHAQDKEETIRVDSSVVLVGVSVTDRAGKAVTGIKKSEFSILDNGVVRPLSIFAAESTPFAAIILVDTSGSMGDRVSVARGAAIAFLDRTRVEDVVAIYSFDSAVKLISDFDRTRMEQPESFFKMKADGMTVLNDAIVAAANVLNGRPEKRRAIVVLSDGADTRSKNTAERAIKAASDAGANIYTVDLSSIDDNGIEVMRARSALRNFAEKSGGTFVASPNGSTVREAFRVIAEELGNQYTLGFEPDERALDGKFHPIEVRISRPGLTIRSRKGYYAGKRGSGL
ncbi:MAG: VWA domain-containing protein [Acidobacteria bacterium]|nr:VWA domain-containing protein [Acidobacteriota bacterium]MCW5950586.1 VWA domain-containing protein [Pyrinomonadaceae bacterium]